MSDLKKYINKRKANDPDFAQGYDEGFEEFKIGLILKQEREKSGLTQEELAKKIKTTEIYVSDYEMADIMKDAKLVSGIKKGLDDVKKGKYKIVE